MHWHILGAGAIGTLWADLLTQSGQTVSLIRRTAAETRTAILVSAGQQSHRFYPEIHTPATLEGPVGHLLIATKAQHTVAALQPLLPHLHAGSQVVLLQNGMGQHEAVAQQLPTRQLWAASTTAGAWRETAEHLHLVSLGETRVGPWHSDTNQLPSGWTDLPTPIIACADIRPVLWRKLAINCAINPLTALHRCRNGELLTDPARLNLLREVCAEVEQVAQALSMPLFDNPLHHQAEAVARSTAENLSSMLQDIRQGRETEIEHITGFLCRQAERLAIDTPINRDLLQQVRNLSQAKEPLPNE